MRMATLPRLATLVVIASAYAMPTNFKVASKVAKSASARGVILARPQFAPSWQCRGLDSLDEPLPDGTAEAAILR